MTTKTILRLMCLSVLGCILVAGLWPFHAPKNDISWLSNTNGLLFGEYGSLLSSGAFTALESSEGACSIEIWLQPGFEQSGTILAFYRPKTAVLPFEIWQSGVDLGIRHSSADQSQHVERSRIYVSDLFDGARLVFITISSGPAGTAVYEDGVLVRKVPDFRFSAQDLAGQFTVGNAPGRLHLWHGKLKALAIYDRELGAAEVSQHYGNWTKNTPSELASSRDTVALFMFDEGKGNVAHNLVNSASNLLIPNRFFVLREELLEPPWSEFYPEWSYWGNVGINIAGFVPFGFFFCAYFTSVRKIERAALVAVISGFVVSLIIEVSQAFLPTRNSGMTDLITNTSGTALGAIVWTWIATQTWFVQLIPAMSGSIEQGDGHVKLEEELTELCNRHAQQ
jgi:hypothetical protein